MREIDGQEGRANCQSASIAIWGRPSPTATRLGMPIFTLTKGFQPSRPRQLARQPYAMRLRNMQVVTCRGELRQFFVPQLFYSRFLPALIPVWQRSERKRA